jgi:thiazole synthase ThiGH ThiG subunit
VLPVILHRWIVDDQVGAISQTTGVMTMVQDWFANLANTVVFNNADGAGMAATWGRATYTEDHTYQDQNIDVSTFSLRDSLLLCLCSPHHSIHRLI